MTTKALVVIGSRTAEDRYGITSGNRVAQALRGHGWCVDVIHAADGHSILRRLVDDRPDIIVPVGFGAPCEDGHISAVARLAGIPCAGPTPATGALMQDKSVISRIVDSLFANETAVRSPRGFTFTAALTPAEIAAEFEALHPPFLVKPCCSGSSEGLTISQTVEQAIAAAEKIVDLEGKVLIQQLEDAVTHEVSCTVLDGPDGPRFLPIVELRRDDVEVLGVDEKFGANGLDRHILPARLPAETTLKIERVVMSIRREIGRVGLSRTDILVLSSGELVILELNGIPGLLLSSIACDSARAAGMEFDELALAYARSAWLERPEPRIWGFGAVAEEPFAAPQ